MKRRARSELIEFGFQALAAIPIGVRALMRIFEIRFELQSRSFLGDQLLPHLFERLRIDEHLACLRPRVGKADDRLIKQIE
jgi:hypothetical protein